MNSRQAANPPHRDVVAHGHQEVFEQGASGRSPLDLAQSEIRRLQSELERAFARIDDLQEGGNRGLL